MDNATKYQKSIIYNMVFGGCYIEITKNKMGWFVHKVVYPDQSKTVIKSSTSKAIRRFLSSRIKVK